MVILLAANGLKLLLYLKNNHKVIPAAVNRLIL